MNKKLNKGAEQKYCREQLLRSGLFPNRDAAAAVLRDEREYTADEAKKAVQNFMERQVN